MHTQSSEKDLHTTRPVLRTTPPQCQQLGMASADDMKAEMMRVYQPKMEVVRQLLLVRRTAEVQYMELRRAPTHSGPRTEAEQVMEEALTSTLAMWNRACNATTYALFHDMYEWMDQRYADPSRELRDMDGHFGMRWAEWIRERIVELSPPIP